MHLKNKEAEFLIEYIWVFQYGLLHCATPDFSKSFHLADSRRPNSSPLSTSIFSHKKWTLNDTTVTIKLLRVLDIQNLKLDSGCPDGVPLTF